MLERKFPVLRGPIHNLLQDGLWLIRPILALLLIAGGLLSFLPVLGIWMLPIGLLLLAVDFPTLQPVVSNFIIRARRRIEQRLRNLKGRRR